MALTATVTTGRPQYVTGRPVEIVMGLYNDQSRTEYVRVQRNWEYDIIIRDSRKRVVWQWSKDKRQPPSPYEIRVDARDRRETRERWDGRDESGRPVPAGVYYIEARVFPCRPVFTSITLLEDYDNNGGSRWDRDRDRDWDRDRGGRDRDRDRDRDGRFPGERGFFASLRTNPRSASVGEEVDVIYTLSNQSRDAVLYEFPNGRMYELEAKLRGRTVWRWSQGRFFTQSFTQLYLPPGSRKEFHISFPIARGTARGDYELVAYLVPRGYAVGSAGEATTRLRVD